MSFSVQVSNSGKHYELRNNETTMSMRGFRKITIILVCLMVISFTIVGFYCGDTSCAFSSRKRNHFRDEVRGYVEGKSSHYQFENNVLNREFTLNLEDEDVLVFLHIQKTGGTTFGRHLVKNLDLDKPCQCEKGSKKCECLTHKKTLWLFSRYSTGWVCGLHADWTELTNCVDKQMDKQEQMHRKRRYHYLTILRDPVSRYLSEWKHVKRGATWKNARLFCNGRQATLKEVPFCYEADTWEGVTLDNFLRCKYNLANNRQTRMLANLSKVNCYNNTGMTDEERDQLMLESAKENLRNLSYFGLTEYQSESQKLFEYVFNIHFLTDFIQYNVTHSQKTNPTKKQWEAIIKVNALDIALYQYAKDLFKQRVQTMMDSLNDKSIFPESR